MSEEIIRNLYALNVTMSGGSTLLNIVLAFVMFGVALRIIPSAIIGEIHCFIIMISNSVKAGSNII